MIDVDDIILVLIGFASELIGTITGFGSSTFFVPAALMLESFQTVLVLTAILHTFGNSSRLFLFRTHFMWGPFLKLAIPYILFSAIGAFIMIDTSPESLKRALGGLLILLSVVFLIGHNLDRFIPPRVGMLLAAFSGLSTGLVGTGGALRGLALAALRVPKSTFVALSAAIDIGGDTVRSVIYIKSGLFQWHHWFYVPALMLAALLGSIVGKWALAQISQRMFERLVAVFVFLSGLMFLIAPDN